MIPGTTLSPVFDLAAWQAEAYDTFMTDEDWELTRRDLEAAKAVAGKPNAWRVAVHEGGHAVAAAHAGLPINIITMDQLRLQPGTGGHIQLDCHHSPIVLLAGMAAEIAVLGNAPCAWLGGDRSLLADMEFSRATWLETYRLMRSQRPAVLAIAEALLREGTLLPVQLYEEVLTPFFPEAQHPRIADFEPPEPSVSELARRFGADKWED